MPVALFQPAVAFSVEKAIPPGDVASERQVTHLRVKNRVSAKINQICGCSSSGRAPPCQGGGSEFEPRQPLQIKGHRCHSVLFFWPQHTRFLHLHEIRGRGPRESLRILRGVDASSSLVSRSKSKGTDVIRCFSFARSTLASSTFIKSEVGVPAKACGFCGVWMRVQPRQPLQLEAPSKIGAFVLPQTAGRR